jgi:hypothetical protein
MKNEHMSFIMNGILLHMLMPWSSFVANPSLGLATKARVCKGVGQD